MQILEKWEQTQLLNAFREDRRPNAAHCLQAQINLNEKLEDDKYAAFKRASVPIVVRALSQSRAFTRNQFDMSDGLQEAANTHVFTTKFNPPKSGNLQAEADYLAKLAGDILKEFDELFGDQYNKYITFHGFEVTDHGNLLLHYDM